MRQEFIHSAIRWGTGGELPEHLKRWWEEFRAPLEVEQLGAGRLCNPFWLECKASIRVQPQEIIHYISGRGAIGISNTGDSVLVRGARSRSALEVVAGMGVGLESLSGMRVGESNLRMGKNAWVKVGRRLTLREQMAVEEVGRWIGGIKGLAGGEFKIPSKVVLEPWGLFLTLTLTKLAIKSAEMVVGGWAGNDSEKILNLLALWKGLDDDARLALSVGVERIGKTVEENLAPLWGLTGARWEGFEAGRFVAGGVVPRKGDIEAAKWLIRKRDPVVGVRFSPLEVHRIPAGFYWVPRGIRMNLPEAAWEWRDVCGQKQIKVGYTEDQGVFLPNFWPLKRVARLWKGKVGYSGGGGELYLNNNMIRDHRVLGELRKVFIEAGIWKSVWDVKGKSKEKEKWSRVINF